MNRKYGFAALLVAGAGLLAAVSLPASAFSVPVQQQTAAADSGMSDLLINVRDRNIRDGRQRHIRDGNRRWNYRLHGDRCRRRNGNCNNFYGGYYYVNPWWLAAPLLDGGFGYGDGYGNDYADENVYDGGGYSPAYGSRHVRWCMERYRSYNPRFNTWVSYGGGVRQCVSPYS